MEKKKSKKGLFNILFAPKSSSGCCNIKFEEITEEKNSAGEKEVDNSDTNKKSKKESTENN